MKKILGVLAIALLATGLFAKTWTNNVGVGFTMPISTIGVDEAGADDIFQMGYGAQGFYMGYHQNGITVKATESVGLATSKDVSLQDNDTNFGVFSNLEIGAGYTFIKDEKLTLSVLGMLGLDLSVYSDSKDDVAYDTTKADYSATYGFAMFSLGADLYVSYKFKPNFGVFGNVAGRYLVAGGAFGEKKYEYKIGGRTETNTTDYDAGDLRGKFRVQPTIGVVWTF